MVVKKNNKDIDADDFGESKSEQEDIEEEDVIVSKQPEHQAPPQPIIDIAEMQRTIAKLEKTNEFLSIKLRESQIELKSKDINKDSIDTSFEKATTLLNNSSKLLSDTLKGFEGWGKSDCKEYTDIKKTIDNGFPNDACELYSHVVHKLIDDYYTLRGMNEEVKRNVNSIREELKAR